MIHYKLLVCGPMLGGPIFITEFDSQSGAEAARGWYRGKGYDAEVVIDPEPESEEDAARHAFGGPPEPE